MHIFKGDNELSQTKCKVTSLVLDSFQVCDVNQQYRDLEKIRSPTLKTIDQNHRLLSSQLLRSHSTT